MKQQQRTTTTATAAANTSAGLAETTTKNYNDAPPRDCRPGAPARNNNKELQLVKNPCEAISHGGGETTTKNYNKNAVLAPLNALKQARNNNKELQLDHHMKLIRATIVSGNNNKELQLAVITRTGSLSGFLKQQQRTTTGRCRPRLWRRSGRWTSWKQPQRTTTLVQQQRSH